MPRTRLVPGGPVVSRIGLGLAALGRPAYITTGRGGDLPDRSVAGLAARTFTMLDAAYGAGIRYFDAARSYGRAEEFLGAWLAERGVPDAVAGSKWGYRYTGDWRLDAEYQEIKEHSLAMFTTQLAETRALLGDRLALYQIHSLTTDSGPLDDPDLLAALAGLRAQGVIVGISTSGPGQADTVRRALEATADGRPVFSSAQVTWNLLEPSVGPAAAEAAGAGWAILIKEAVANGRLAPGGDPAGHAGRAHGARRRPGRDRGRHRDRGGAGESVGERGAVGSGDTRPAGVKSGRARRHRDTASRPRRAACCLLVSAVRPDLAIT